MQITKGTWRMREQRVPGSLSSSPAQEPGNEANECSSCADFTGPGMLLSFCAHSDWTDRQNNHIVIHMQKYWVQAYCASCKSSYVLVLPSTSWLGYCERKKEGGLDKWAL